MLEYLCVFDKEQDRLGQTWLPKRTALRVLLVSALVPIVPLWFVFYPAHEFPMFFTNWGLIMTISSLLVTAFMPYDTKYRQKPNKMALNHLLFSMASLAEIIICSIYWTLLHQNVMRKNAHSTAQMAYQCYAHALPGLATLINFCLTDVLYYRKQFKLWYVFLFIFCVTNYHGVKKSGVEEAYSFLTWQDPTETAIVIGGFVVLIAIIVIT